MQDSHRSCAASADFDPRATNAAHPPRAGALFRSFVGSFDLATRSHRNLVDPTEPVRGFAIREDGKEFATIGPSGTLRLWDFAKLTLVRQIQLPANDKLIGWSLVFAPDGRYSVIPLSVRGSDEELWEAMTVESRAASFDSASKPQPDQEADHEKRPEPFCSPFNGPKDLAG